MSGGKNSTILRVNEKIETLNLLALPLFTDRSVVPEGRFVTTSTAGVTSYAGPTSEFAYLTYSPGARSDVMTYQTDPLSQYTASITLETGGLTGIIGRSTLVGLPRSRWGNALPLTYEDAQDIAGTQGVDESDYNGTAVVYDVGDPVAGMAVISDATGKPVWVPKAETGQPWSSLVTPAGLAGAAASDDGVEAFMFRQLGIVVKVEGPLVWFLFTSTSVPFLMDKAARFPDFPNGESQET